MPTYTIGSTNPAGASNGTNTGIASNSVWLNKRTLSGAAAGAKWISLRAYISGGTGTATKVRLAIYDDLAGSPNNLLGGGEVTVPVGAAAAEYTVPLSGAPLAPNGDYWVGFQFDQAGTSSPAPWYAGSSAGPMAYGTSAYSSGLPSPFNEAGVNGVDDVRVAADAATAPPTLPVFVSDAESQSGGGTVTGFAATLPSGLVVGNVLVMAAILYYGSTPPPNPIVSSPGWTTLFTSGQWGFGARMRLAVFFKRIDGTEVNPIVANDQGASVFYAVGMAQYANVVATGSPLDGAGVSGTASIGATAEAPAYTTSGVNSMLLCFGTGGESVPYTLSFAGNVQRFNAGNPGVSNEVTMCELPRPLPGTLAAGTWSRSGGNQGWMGHALALLGAAAPVTTAVAGSDAGAGTDLVVRAARVTADAVVTADAAAPIARVSAGDTGTILPSLSQAVPLGIPPVRSPELTTLARSLLEYLPPYEADDPIVQNLLDAVANELARIEARAKDVIWKFYPQNADDTYGTLGMWEMLLGLPVMPAGLSVIERQDIVLSAVRARDAGTGIAWRQLMTQAIGTSFDVQVGPAPYTITIRTSMGYAGATTQYVRTVARRISPAHLLIESGFKEHFIVGISSIGDAL